MQSLEVISIHIWDIVIAMCNLAILYWILKKFLYQPVQKVRAARQAELDSQYKAASDAQEKADEARRTWETRMQGAEAEADGIRSEAKRTAQIASGKMVEDARKRAREIVAEAEEQAALEKRRAEAEMRQEIVDTSAAMTAKLLGREVRPEDHQALIDAFLQEDTDAQKR